MAKLPVLLGASSLLSAGVGVAQAFKKPKGPSPGQLAAQKRQQRREIDREAEARAEIAAGKRLKGASSPLALFAPTGRKGTFGG